MNLLVSRLALALTSESSQQPELSSGGDGLCDFRDRPFSSMGHLGSWTIWQDMECCRYQGDPWGEACHLNMSMLPH